MLSAIGWILLGTASCTAVVVGVRRHRPGRAAPWFLIAGAVACSGIGDALYALHWETASDIGYYGMIALVTAALLEFTRRGTLLVDRARLLDMVAATCAALLLIWVFVLGPVSQFGPLESAYIMGCLLLVGVSIRLTIAAGRNVSAVLLLVGSLGALAGDVVYPLAPGALADTGYVAMYVAWGLAALHPAMVRLTQPTAPRPSVWRSGWAVVLGVSVATPPVVLVIEALTGRVDDGLVIAVAGAITLAMTVSRLIDLVAQNSQAVTRERGLREASADLVAAADVPAVDRAVRAAIAQLAPSPAVRRIVVAVDDRQLAQENLPSDAPSGAPADASSGAPADASSGAPSGAPSGAAAATERRSRSWWVVDGGDEATLVCPLWLEPLAVARPSGGGLVLTGRREVLDAARDTLEVLAGQAALALDRISLVEAVGRRDSDLYLRAVIRNTSDLMLVIDEDQRIRYASPGLLALVGHDELSPLAKLEDLVNPDDRGQVRRALSTEGDGTLFCALCRANGTQVLVEATYRDLREDRLVQGFVVTIRDVTDAHDPAERIPHVEHVDELPAWVNRRSAQHKFRY